MGRGTWGGSSGGSCRRRRPPPPVANRRAALPCNCYICLSTLRDAPRGAPGLPRCTRSVSTRLGGDGREQRRQCGQQQCSAHGGREQREAGWVGATGAWLFGAGGRQRGTAGDPAAGSPFPGCPATLNTASAAPLLDLTREASVGQAAGPIPARNGDRHVFRSITARPPAAAAAAAAAWGCWTGWPLAAGSLPRSRRTAGWPPPPCAQTPLQCEGTARAGRLVQW